MKTTRNNNNNNNNNILLISLSPIIGLAICWSLTLSTTILLTDIGPLSAISIGVSEAYASLTITFYFLGATLSSIQSIELFSQVGRFWGFTFGCIAQLLGCICGVIAIIKQNSTILFLGCLCIGFSQGIGQFYRFAALDISENDTIPSPNPATNNYRRPENKKGKNITTVLSGGLFAALIGPTLATWTRNMLPQEYAGSYLIIGILAILNQFFLYLIPFVSMIENSSEVELLTSSNNNNQNNKYNNKYIQNNNNNNNNNAIISPTRGLWEIILQPHFIIACGTATLSNAAMVMIMSQFSVDMNRHNFKFNAISFVLESHILSMYFPSFFTGLLLELMNPTSLTLVGNTIFFIGIFVMYFLSVIFHSYYGYLFGMILIGIAWNFAYSTSTILLCSCYKQSESYLVQGLNDTFLMIISGLGSLVSGLVFAHFGWIVLLSLISILMLICSILLLSSYLFAEQQNQYNDNTNQIIVEFDTSEKEGTNYGSINR